MTRTFLAIELPDAIRVALARQTALLAQAAPEIRWTPAENLHLTLAFLGELDDARLAEAQAATAEATTAHAPFALELGAVGIFGSRRAPRVIWVGVGGQTQALLALHAWLADALAARGFAREERPYSPHLTLARLKAPPRAGSLTRLLAHIGERVEAPPWRVEALSVMRSALERPAARYTRLRAYPLAAPSA